MFLHIEQCSKQKRHLLNIPRSHGKILSSRVDKTGFFIVFTLMLNNITALTVAVGHVLFIPRHTIYRN